MYSKEYISQLQGLHADASRRHGFGGKAKKLGQFHSFMDEWKPSTLLDYGCGKGHILADLKDRYPNTVCEGYDPAVPAFNKKSFDVFDCVFSNDVLEHIEPEYLEDVLTHIDNLASKYVWLRIDTMPARKKLSDGRNAHLILETPDWWKDKIQMNINGTIKFFQLDKKGKLDIAIEK
jgi:trans-aconitate methyltransferase